jgi:hypothetical protein
LYEQDHTGCPTSERSAGLGAGMTTSDRTTALVIRWMAVYTRSLDPAVAARRQAELASDLWEQRAHARQVGAPDPLVALSILRRAVTGVPADLRWRQHQLAAARGRPRRQPGWQLSSTRTRALASIPVALPGRAWSNGSGWRSLSSTELPRLTAGPMVSPSE